MPTPQALQAETRGIDGVRAAAIDCLRQGVNPFTFAVATAGTEQDCLHFDVSDVLDSQRSDLLAIVDLYRNPRQPSRVFPILGDAGTGKTHLLTTLQAELQRRAIEEGRESLVIAADHFSASLDVIDFFFWQLVNHVLATAGPGYRTLNVITERLTAQLLGEALRQLPAPQQLQLFPPTSLLDRITLSLGMRRATQSRLTSVRRLIEKCDNQSAGITQQACQEAGFAPERAAELVEEHLNKTEPSDVAGTLRKSLYSRLVRMALLHDQNAVEDFLTEDFRQGPPQVTSAGQLTRRLFSTLTSLLRTLACPVVFIFDQLEDFLGAASDDTRQELRESFGRAVTALVNNVPGLCVLIFAERGVWNNAILGRLDRYIRDRLDQEFTLPGRPSQRAIEMPDRLSRSLLTQLIQRRVRSALGDFDPTGLPAVFPFSDDQVLRLEGETTIRMCIQKLSTWYNLIVHPDETPMPAVVKPGPTTPASIDEALTAQLKARWHAATAAARKTLNSDSQTGPALIPEVQSALDRWLGYLQENHFAGNAPWAKVELIADPSKGPFGYLNVLRFGSPDTPGIGIAAWLGERKLRLTDLQRRLAFFDDIPCPVRTLILFRRDGTAALSGASKDTYDAAVKRGRDVRVQPYEPKEMESLLAFPRWLQVVKPEVDAAGEAGKPTLQAFVHRLSETLLRWIESWRPIGEA